MENFMKMLSTQAILLVYMAVGFYCRKRGIIEKKMQGKLTDFVLRITLPCMIFNSFSMHITLDMLKQAALCLGVAFFICFAAWLGGKVVYNMYPKEKKSVLQYATLVNNAAFLGLPIVKAVLGEAGMFLASIFIIPNRIFMMRLLNADPIMTGCAVILTAMPAGSTTALLAEKYGSDPVYASKCLLTNTLFSLITIPIMTLFI